MRRRRLFLAAGVALAVLAADLLTKAWATGALADRPGLVVIPRVLVLDLAHNTGSVFGLFADAPWIRPLLLAIGLVVLAVLSRLALALPTAGRWPFAAVGLAAGGAVGNLHDRLLHRHLERRSISQLDLSTLLAHAERVADAIGQAQAFIEIPTHAVVDFVVVYWAPGRRWPAFNLADVALAVAAAIAVALLARRSGPEKER
jgi:signal peptidase II